MNNTITAQEAINSLGKISKARFLAMDDDGEWWAFENKPKIKAGYWSDNIDGGQCCFGDIVNIQPAENWKESLVEYQP